jgi:outer membrane cobalamin receptor
MLQGVSLLLAVGSPVLAQDAKKAEDELLALLNTPVTVASQKAMTTRESPGIISLVTREEILASGARDLIDVLRLVPGFDFASDIQGAVGPAVRGLWGFEGKVLLLVDGQELNETRYGTVQFGNHVPVDQIRQIEIIRGPGSAIYGGFAELAVINVITRDGADLNGVSGALNYGATANSYTQRTANLAYGAQRGDLSYSLSASVGTGQRSEEIWNAFGQTRSLEGASKLTQGFFNFGMKFKGLSVRAIQDNYAVEDFTFYRAFAPTSMRFSGSYFEAKYLWEFSNTFKLVPRVAYKVQQPWYYPDDPTSNRKKEASRTTLGLQAQWAPMPTLDLLFGADAWKDEGKISGDASTWSNGQSTISYNNQAFFGQALWTTPFGNITLGARQDHNSQFGSSFVPRLAFTKAWEAFHLKVLASKAFRAPAIENFELNPDVKPEKTTALEVEFGVQLGRVFVAVNVFDLSIKDPMVYFYDPDTGFENYQNYSKTGSQGVEMDFQIRGDWGFFKSGLTVARAKDNQVPDFTVEGNSKYLVAMPNVKVTFLGSFKLGHGFTFAPSVVGLGPRFTYESNGGPVKRESAALMNLMLHYRPEGLPVFFTVGSHNATGANVGFPKAYQGTDGDTYPSQPRDYFLRLGYNF